jgi:Ni/Co efflux regulator RcnB
MKKTLLALSTALLLAGAAGTASAQQYYYDRYGTLVVDGDVDRDGVPDRYDGVDDIRYGYDARASDRDCDGVPDRYDQYDPANVRDRDCDGVPNGYDLADDRGYYSTRIYSAPRYVAPVAYAYNRWDVGTRLPYGYYGSRYYIDYRPYGLAPPPYGYRWNRVGSDAYLVSMANGLIAEVAYNLFR